MLSLSTDAFVQELKLIGGAMQLAEGMANLLGDRVMLGRPVVKVEQNEAGVTVQCANGDIFQVS